MFDLVSNLDQLIDAVNELLLPEVLLSTGVLTAVAAFCGRMAWALASWVLRHIKQILSRTPKSHAVGLTKTKLPFEPSVIRPKCLIIRYGTDPYIEKMASDSERYDGRLLNKIIEIPFSQNADGSTNFTLKIPVHRRLGTQFKCFFEVTDEKKVPEVKEFLSACDTILQPDISTSPFHNRRIFFLLRDFAIVESVEGLKNNMCYPE